MDDFNEDDLQAEIEAGKREESARIRRDLDGIIEDPVFWAVKERLRAALDRICPEPAAAAGGE